MTGPLKPLRDTGPLGYLEIRVDGKGRSRLPAAVVSHRQQHGFPALAFAAFSTTVLRLIPLDSNAWPRMEIDASGRVLLPCEMRELYNLTGTPGLIQFRHNDACYELIRKSNAP